MPDLKLRCGTEKWQIDGVLGYSSGSGSRCLEQGLWYKMLQLVCILFWICLLHSIIWHKVC